MNAVSSSSTIVRTPLFGRRLLIARLAWTAVIVLALIVFIVSLPVRANELRMIPAEGEPRVTYQLRPGDAPVLDEIGLSLSTYAVYITGGEFIFVCVYLICGFVIFWRKSDEWFPMLVSAVLVAYGVSALYNTNALVKVYPQWAVAVYPLYTVAFGGLAFLCFIFPSGKFVPRWTKWFAFAWLGWGVLWALLPNTPLNIYTWQPSQRRMLYLIVYGLAIAVQVYRYLRVSTPPQRQQTRWIILGLLAAFIGFSIVVVPTYFIPQLFIPGTLGMGYTLFAMPMIVISLLFIPLSVTIALLRYRLWETAGLVNRTLTYVVLTIVLGIVFLLSVFVVQQIFTAFTGSSEAVIPVGVAMLLIGVLFNPTRRTLQRMIDRRLYGLDVTQLDANRNTEFTPGVHSERMLGAYRVGELIGRGGMGEVYRGHHDALNRDVAIKVLSDSLARQDVFRARFEREAQTVAALRHPNIVSMFDFGITGSTYYMVMEYVAGQELGDYLKQVKHLSLDATRVLLEDICAALDYAHGQGLVHRDIKPSNVMLQKITMTDANIDTQRPFRAILMDFGIAKTITEGTSMTQTGMLGTVDYIAPEQAVSAKGVDKRADIYALGVMTYQMLTGQLPFSGENSAMVLLSHLNAPPPDPRTIMPDLPEEAAMSILRALSKEPDARFDTAGEFAQAFRGNESTIHIEIR
jgi:tRNA A-37 threonylcarbamoyl transferase component Bud32